MRRDVAAARDGSSVPTERVSRSIDGSDAVPESALKLLAASTVAIAAALVVLRL